MAGARPQRLAKHKARMLTAIAVARSSKSKTPLRIFWEPAQRGMKLAELFESNE